jgi:hypothetical protein
MRWLERAAYSLMILALLYVVWSASGLLPAALRVTR